MELTKMVQDNLVPIGFAGAAIVIGTIILANFDGILLTCKDFSARFEKKPEPQKSITTVEGVGNVGDVYKKELINHENKINENILVPSSTCLKDTLNVKRVYENKVKGGSSSITRTIDLTKK